jgi:hypothetical protein
VGNQNADAENDKDRCYSREHGQSCTVQRSKRRRAPHSQSDSSGNGSCNRPDDFRQQRRAALEMAIVRTCAVLTIFVFDSPLRKNFSPPLDGRIQLSILPRSPSDWWQRQDGDAAKTGQLPYQADGLWAIFLFLSSCRQLQIQIELQPQTISFRSN